MEAAFSTMRAQLSSIAQYLVAHAHKSRVLANMNLRECYNLFNYQALAGGADYRLAYPEAPIGPFRSDVWFEYGSTRQDWRQIY